jgi:ERCC4-type nuclease
VAALDAGDFRVATSDHRVLGIERKTSDDLLNTLGSNRLFNQAQRLRESTNWAYLLITGPLAPNADGYVITERKTGWRWDAVQGALLTMQEMGVSVIHASDDLEAAIIRLAARDRNEVTIYPPALDHSILSEGEAVIVSLPGIGLDRLRRVQEYCGKEPFWALIALTDPQDAYKTIPSLGPGTIARIRQALGLYDNVKLGLFEEDQPLIEVRT